MKRHLIATVAALGTLVLASCGDDDSGSATPTPSASEQAGERPDGANVTIAVPKNAPTIAAAVNLAKPGDLVLVSPGVYPESVLITTPNITLRGTDRNKVVIDGEVLRANGVVVNAHGVAVQNLTVRNHTQNGVLITGDKEAAEETPGEGGYNRRGETDVHLLESFAVSHVTSYNNGLYGIYAFSASNGVIEDSYTSGSADSGLYVGQCKPCNIVVRGNISERNAVGYEGTNASGEMYVVGNRFVGNRVGATSNSDYQEALLPQKGATLAGNLIAGNSSAESPEQAEGGFGIGVGIAGGTENVVRHNRISSNPTVGLIITSAEDLAPIGNTVEQNAFAGNGTDVAFTPDKRALGSGNCLRDNEMSSSVPAGLPACPTDVSTPSGVVSTGNAPPGVPFTKVTAPPAQPQLPDATTAGAVAVPKQPTPIQLDDYAVPPMTFLAGTAGVRL